MTIVSRHYLRRTARRKARSLERAARGIGDYHYRVEPARHGPYRWYVVQLPQADITRLANAMSDEVTRAQRRR